MDDVSTVYAFTARIILYEDSRMITELTDMDLDDDIALKVSWL